MIQRFCRLTFLTAVLTGVFSCTNLDPKVYDQIENFWNTPEQVAAGVAPAYSGLRGLPSGAIFNLNEVTSDEVVVPTRGSDWYDNGAWQQLWQHGWDPNHGDISSAWTFIYTGVANINRILQTVGALEPAPSDLAGIQAELKTIRAFYYFQALDLFGNVPVVENYEVDLTTVTNKPRAEVFAFVENELKTNLPNLRDAVDGSTYGKVTQWFSQALLAKLYLNAQVYTGTPKWAECIAACDAIINSGKYSIQPNFFDNFKVNNESSVENIFVIPFDATKGLGGLNTQMQTLHYQSNETFGLAATPWNGFCTVADFYNQFDPVDKRREMFLVGQQYSRTGEPLEDLQVKLPLKFDPDVTAISSAAPSFRMAGARSVKYQPTPNTTGDMNNDFAVFRLGDIILMKAEAELRSGTGDPVATLNYQSSGVSIRSRAGLPDFTSINLDDLLKERAREMAWEMWRRNDLIRFGKYLAARVPEKAVSQSFRTLFPIPKAELDRNSNLTQNDGYPQ
ncbi:RagB/SusD family nutrient uptake outer membrane protein [Agriterribacter sp.]|uniref:RagB/SusD family nutrient uptake outer membrane protein n=1 Tax=Agriterribacter sp. TaxID=2821509 RepID=UPI002BFEDDA4|nr:RagB/SusD family nutrient uptake outer membrane protein [Agriterribacter sp.]HTN08677.1 RagB/SusD family nutrient uptake outer membrane protein [Agriterribacter sp.]